MISDDLFTALSEIEGIDGPYDSKLPDNYTFDGPPAIVFSAIDDVPDADLGGDIQQREDRWQVSVFSTDVRAARSLKETVIEALQKLVSDTILWCEFAGSPGEIYDSENIPATYHIPIDFLIRH